jgi:hypothetical protein
VFLWDKLKAVGSGHFLDDFALAPTAKTTPAMALPAKRRAQGARKPVPHSAASEQLLHVRSAVAAAVAAIVGAEVNPPLSA